MITKKDISDAYVFFRKNNQTISDEVLDFINLAAQEKLDSQSKNTKIKTAGKLGLIFDEQRAGTIDMFSVDFGSVDISLSYDQNTKCPRVSIGDRTSGIMRYYDIVDGRPLLAETDEEYCEPISGKEDL